MGLRVTTSILLAAAMLAAVVLSASATIRRAVDSGVAAGIAPFAVGLLEVLALVGTLLWVLDGRGAIRRQAAAGVMLSSAVTLVAGVHAYGLFGAVGPLGLVVTVHLVASAWRDQPVVREAPEPIRTATTVDVPAAVAQSEPAGTPDPGLPPTAVDVPASTPDPVTAVMTTGSHAPLRTVGRRSDTAPRGERARDRRRRRCRELKIPQDGTVEEIDARIATAEGGQMVTA